jgi:hypothetical protein
MKNKSNPLPNSYEPKMENRFIVVFPEYFYIPSYVIHNTTRPSCSVRRDMISWNNITFDMYDPVCPSTSQAIINGLSNLKKLDSYKLKILIQELGPVGDKVAEWELTGEISYIDFGSLNWESDEPVKITLDFKIEDCKLNY